VTPSARRKRRFYANPSNMRTAAMDECTSNGSRDGTQTLFTANRE
jgi:hypothetical protein